MSFSYVVSPTNFGSSKLDIVAMMIIYKTKEIKKKYGKILVEMVVNGKIVKSSTFSNFNTPFFKDSGKNGYEVIFKSPKERNMVQMLQGVN